MRSRQITKNIMQIDRKLFCEKGQDGIFRIYRKSSLWQEYDVDGKSVLIPVDSKSLIMALTENWSVTGRPVEWGILPIMRRLREIDGHNRDVYSELVESREKAEKSVNRARFNKTEDSIREALPGIRKAWSDINVSSLSKRPTKKQIRMGV